MRLWLPPNITGLPRPQSYRKPFNLHPLRSQHPHSHACECTFCFFNLNRLRMLASWATFSSETTRPQTGYHGDHGVTKGKQKGADPGPLEEVVSTALCSQGQGSCRQKSKQECARPSGDARERGPQSLNNLWFCFKDRGLGFGLCDRLNPTHCLTSFLCRKFQVRPGMFLQIKIQCNLTKHMKGQTTGVSRNKNT